MISARVVELIEIHADQLTNEVARSLVGNARTTGFRRVRAEDAYREGDGQKITRAQSRHIRIRASAPVTRPMP